MKNRSRRGKNDDIQYAVLWLANELHRLPPQHGFFTLLRDISDEAINLVTRNTTAGWTATVVLTSALATKLRGNPNNDY
jgi:hypothetical protein